MRSELKQFKDLTSRAKRPVAITGAGVSAESGVPTFRGTEGLWRHYNPQDLATPEAFARDPQLVWEWYDWRRSAVRDARPNPAHRWLAAYESAHPRFLLVTQNVDGLHALAGSRHLVEIHGNLWHLRCTECGWGGENRQVPLPLLPHCPNCRGLLRPGVVWFGEPLPAEGLAQAVEAAREADLVLMLGTSAVVYPVAGLPDLASSAEIVEVNPEETSLTRRATLSVRAPAGAFLEPLLEGGRLSVH